MRVAGKVSDAILFKAGGFEGQKADFVLRLHKTSIVSQSFGVPFSKDGKLIRIELSGTTNSPILICHRQRL